MKISELKKYLTEEFLLLSKKEEFNIFLHQSSASYEQLHDEKLPFNQIAQNNIAQALQFGLPCNKYASVNGTMLFVGNTKNTDVDRIINYSFDSKFDSEKYIVIIMVPKFIKMDNKVCEFSSYGSSNDIFSKELSSLKNYFSSKKEYVYSNQTQTSLFDATIKQDIPAHYIMGYAKINIKDDTAEFYKSNNFYFLKSKNEKKKIDRDNVEILSSKIKKFNSKNINELLFQSTQNAKKDIELSSDFDF